MILLGEKRKQGVLFCADPKQKSERKKKHKNAFRGSFARPRQDLVRLKMENAIKL
jgi:hypothetical protein